jgi:hypothetical protein
MSPQEFCESSHACHDFQAASWARGCARVILAFWVLVSGRKMRFGLVHLYHTFQVDSRDEYSHTHIWRQAFSGGFWEWNLWVASLATTSSTTFEHRQLYSTYPTSLPHYRGNCLFFASPLLLTVRSIMQGTFLRIRVAMRTAGELGGIQHSNGSFRLWAVLRLKCNTGMTTFALHARWRCAFLSGLLTYFYFFWFLFLILTLTSLLILFYFFILFFFSLLIIVIFIFVIVSLSCSWIDYSRDRSLAISSLSLHAGAFRTSRKNWRTV